MGTMDLINYILTVIDSPVFYKKWGMVPNVYQCLLNL